MSTVVVDGPTRDRLLAAGGTVEVRDEAGAVLGEFRRRAFPPVAGPDGIIPGIDPAEVWEAFAQIDAGQGVPHAEVFARLRGRK